MYYFVALGFFILVVVIYAQRWENQKLSRERDHLKLVNKSLSQRLGELLMARAANEE